MSTPDAYRSLLGLGLDVPRRDEVLATYTLQLIGPNVVLPSSLRVPESFRGMLREAEENLTDLLPEGYSVKIREWDE